MDVLNRLDDHLKDCTQARLDEAKDLGKVWTAIGEIRTECSRNTMLLRIIAGGLFVIAGGIFGPLLLAG